MHIYIYISVCAEHTRWYLRHTSWWLRHTRHQMMMAERHEMIAETHDNDWDTLVDVWGTRVNVWDTHVDEFQEESTIKNEEWRMENEATMRPPEASRVAACRSVLQRVAVCCDGEWGENEATMRHPEKDVDRFRSFRPPEWEWFLCMCDVTDANGWHVLLSGFETKQSMRHTATRCNTPQHTATHVSSLPM